MIAIILLTQDIGHKRSDDAPKTGFMVNHITMVVPRLDQYGHPKVGSEVYLTGRETGVAVLEDTQEILAAMSRCEEGIAIQRIQLENHWIDRRKG